MATPIPLRIGEPEQFAAVRDLLDRSGFHEKEICQRLGLRSLSDYRVRPPDGRVPPLDDPLEALIFLFIHGGSVPRPQLEAVLPGDPLTAAQTLGLLEARDRGVVDLIHATVRLYPTHGVYIASDRWTNPDGSEFEMFDDIVYPADIRNTDDFVGILPDTPCEALLDVCAGTGIFALMGAKTCARRAWAFDITGRATVFAEFNARLNGIANVVTAQGDCYEPAGDATFDRIVAHPPYVPVLHHTWTFHAGGSDGEQITRRLIEGLPSRLRPGGRFYAIGMGSDREEGPFEQRIRSWLGQDGKDFDIFLLVRKVMLPAHYAVNTILRGTSQASDLPQWKKLFADLKISNMVHCQIVVQRRATDRPVFTARRLRGPYTTRAEVDWLLDWETRAAVGVGEEILDLRARTGPGTKMQVDYGQEGADWSPAEYWLSVPYPFDCKWNVEPWAAYLTPRANGQTTLRELLGSLIRDEILPANTPPASFAKAAAMLVSGGYLLLENHMPPGPAVEPADTAAADFGD